MKEQSAIKVGKAEGERHFKKRKKSISQNRQSGKREMVLSEKTACSVGEMKRKNMERGKF